MEKLPQRLLALLKESLAPLLPVEISFQEDKDQAHLYWQGKPFVQTIIQAENLSPEEVARWRPVVMALVQEMWQRIGQEKCLEGLPGPQILCQELKKAPLSGLLLKGVRPDFQDTFALAPGLYFLPGPPQRFLSYLKDLWRKEVEVVAASVTFDRPEDVYTGEDLLFLAETFGFSWLSHKARRVLEGELASGKEISRLLKTLLEAWQKGALLLWAEGEKDVLQVFRQELSAVTNIIFPLAKGCLAAVDEPVEKLEALLRDLGLRAGLYVKGAQLPPLAATWMALEHARRLPNPTSVVFEPFTYHVAGDLYLDLGDLGAARKCYLLGREGSAQPVDLLNSLAVIMIQLGDHQQAEEYLRQAIAQSPRDPMLHYNLGLFLREKGSSKAQESFKTAYELAPKESTFAEAWAETLAERGLWQEVKHVLEDFSTSKALFLKARAHYELGDLPEAFSLFKEVARKEPKHAQTLAYLSLLFAQLEGEHDLARTMALEALKLDKNVEEIVSFILTEEREEFL